MNVKQPIDQTMDYSLSETFQALAGHLVSYGDTLSPIVLTQPEAILLYGLISSLVVAVMSCTIGLRRVRRILKLADLLCCSVQGADVGGEPDDECETPEMRLIGNQLQADCFWIAGVARNLKSALREVDELPESQQTIGQLRTCFLRRCSMDNLLYPEQAVDFPKHFGIDYQIP